MILGRKRGDARTRSDRVLRQVESWQAQLPILVDAYLQWRHCGMSNEYLDLSSSWTLHTVTMSGNVYYT